MVEVRRIYDEGLIRDTITHPKVYPAASDDGSPTVDSYKPPVSPYVMYLGCYDDESRYVGLFMLVTVNVATVELHTFMLPKAWGPKAKACAAAAADWIWENTKFIRIITVIPDFNRLAIKFAETGGMSRYGLNPQSWLKNGKVFDTVLMGISKPALEG